MRRRLRIAGYCLTALIAWTAHAQTARDPMRPPGTAAATARPRGPAVLKLEGVISGPVRVAIVNGRLVREGDEIAGARILEVLHDGVRYSRGGQIQSLILPGARALSSVRVARSPEASKP
jgi:hypothetical protein